MNKYTNIVTVMVKDHRKIEQLLENFEASIDKDYKTMVKAFNDFEWHLEKHIFVEEKAIYTQYSPEDVASGYKMLPTLTKQHNYIVNKLAVWRKDVRNKRNITDFNNLKEFIIRHKNFEEKDVYPLLDQVLDEEQKTQILQKINEIFIKMEK